ncbi:muscarinic acetylcholine receptor M2-like [Amphiura filiformis]|uniref:muscarinic acetylcholine receptor M2-like n=1 Tax=Amphiura filiformis TaxID=82378 RepID=UPI003B22818F
MPSFCGQLFLEYWPLSADMCVFFAFIDIILAQASNQSVVMLSIDRYVSLAKPLWHLERRTIGRVVKFMSIAYGLPLLLWLPIAIYFRLRLEHLPPGTCVSQLANDIWIGILIGFIYWVPFILLLIVNIKTYCVIRARRQKNATLNAPPQSSTNPKSVTSQNIAHHVSDLDAATSSTKDLPLRELVAKSEKCESQLRATESHPGRASGPSTSKVSLVSSDIPSTSGTIAARIQQRLNEKERKTKESERRAARTLTLLVVVMLITWTPWSVMVVIASFCPTCFPWYIYEVSLFLTCLNSAANPWCYAARNAARRKIKRTVTTPPLSSKNPKSVTNQKIAHRASDLGSATSSTEDLPQSELVAKSKKSERQLRSTESHPGPASGRAISKASLVSSDIQSTSGTIDDEKERKAKESERRAARTLTLLVMVMLITWTPWSVMVIVASFCPMCFPWYIYEVSLFLTCLNSAANPWCYAAGNVSVRQAMLEIVQCKWLQRARQRP